MYSKKYLRRFLPGGANDSGSWDFPDGNFNFDIDFPSGNTQSIQPNQILNQGQEPFDLPQSRPPIKPMFDIYPYDTDNNSVPDNIQSNSINPYNKNVSNIMNYNRNTAPSSSIVPFNLDTPDKMPTLKPKLLEQKKAPDKISNLVAVESRNKRITNPEKMVNKANAATRGVLGAINNFTSRAKEKAMILNTVNPANFVATQYNKYRGAWTDFGHKTGLQAYDQMGSDRNSYSTYGDFGGNNAQLGGFLQDGGVNNYKLGSEVTMSIPELEAFLKAGGEVDYI